MRKWIFIFVFLASSLVYGGADSNSNVSDEFHKAIAELRLQVSELLKIIESQKEEIARLKKIYADSNIVQSPSISQTKSKITSEINEPFFGIKLGEPLDNLRKRARVTKSKYVFVENGLPAKVWTVRSDDPAIKNIVVCTFEDKIYEIDAEYKNATSANYQARKAQLEKDYPAVYKDSYQELLGKSTFEPKINGVSVGIILNCNASTDKDRKLTLTYVHLALLEQMQSGQK